MPLTRLERGAADTWADAGRSIAGGLSALMQGEAVKQRAQLEQEDTLAGIYAKNMQGNQYGANAERLRRDAELAAHRLGLQQNPLPTAMLELGLPTAKAADFQTRLETGQWGGQYAPPGDGVGPTMPPPADDDTVARLGRNLALLQRMYSTDSNVDQAAAASLKGQQERFIDQVASNPAIAPAVGQAYAATAGRPMFGAVGNTGASVNQFTGQQTIASPELMDLFTRVQRSIWNENNAQAGSAGASAANSRARAELTAAKLKHFMETGRMPGTGEGNSGGLNIGQIRDDIRADFNAIYPIDATRARPKDTPSFQDFTRQWLRQHNIPEAEFFGTARTAAAPGSYPTGAPAEVDDAGLDAALTKAVNAIKRGAPAASARQRFESNGITEARLLAHARAAIARGEDPAIVKERLRTLGISTRGL